MAVGQQSRKNRPRALAIISVLALACAWTTLTASTADATGGIGTVWSVPGSPYQPGAPVVALTFDDGPNPTYTPQVLGILAQYHVPATFFVLGRSGVVYPDLLQAEKAAGHSVENHTWDH